MKNKIETIKQLTEYLDNKQIQYIYKTFKDGTINLVTHEYCLIRDSLKYDVIKVKNQKLILSTINQEKACESFAELF